MKKRQEGMYILLCFTAALILLFTGCADTREETDADGMQASKNSSSQEEPLSIALSSPADSVSLVRGAQTAFSIENPNEALLTALSSDPEILSVSVEGNVLTLTPNAQGTVQIVVTGTKEGYIDAELTIEAEVTLPENEFSVSPSDVSFYIGESGTIKISSLAEGTIHWEYDSSALYFRETENGAAFTSQKAGTFTIRAVCEAPGYLDAEDSFTIEVLSKPMTLYYPTSASVFVGEETELSFSADVENTVLTVHSEGGIEERTDGMTVFVSGKMAGDAAVTVTASAQGCEPLTVKIPVAVTAEPPDVDTSSYRRIVREVIRQTNAEREASGLSALYEDEMLDALATVRSEEASRKWSHTRPDGRPCESILDDYGITYYSTGENLYASGSSSASEAVASWMNSEAHRENILREEFEGIGVGIYYGDDGGVYFTQIFIKK